MADFHALIQLIISNKDIQNTKTKQYRYDEYHYLAMVEEIKLKTIDDYKLIYPSSRIFGIFLLMWMILPLPTFVIISFYNLESLMFPEVGGIALITLWPIVLLYSVIRFVYRSSKYDKINRWERFFSKKGWDIFDRPNFLFSDFATLDKYASFYFSKKLS